MKRLIAVLVVVALVMGGAFAQISFGAWGRGMLVPVQVAPGAEIKDATTTVAASWGGNPRIGFTIRGSSDNIGFQVDMLGDTNKVMDPTDPKKEKELGTFISVGDNAFIYWANDMFKVSIGKVQGDALRGKFGDSPFGGSLTGWTGNADQDNIFTRFYPKCGALVEARPVEGLYVGVAFEGNKSAKESYTDTIQAGVGYTGDFGQVRAQYIGKAQGERVEVAFAPSLSGVALDIGAKIPLDKSYKAVVAVGSAFNVADVAVTARADVKIADTTNAKFYVIPSMGFDFGTIGMDVFVDTTFAKDAGVGFLVAPWYSKGYANGYIKAAVAATKAAAKDAKLGWAVPVIFEYWF